MKLLNTITTIFEKLWESEPREQHARTVSESSMSSFLHITGSQTFAQVRVRGDAKTSQMFPERHLLVQVGLPPTLV